MPIGDVSEEISVLDTPALTLMDESVVDVDTTSAVVEEKVILQHGMTLRMLALDLYGSKEFWIYIYLENKDKIPNPNKVASGIELLLPSKMVYEIDAADPHSIANAKSQASRVLRLL